MATLFNPSLSENTSMDATQRPIKIPPEFANYAEKHGIFDIFKRLLSQLVIEKPADPLDFIIKELRKEDDDVPRIVVIGPPCSGCRSVSKMLCKSLGLAHVSIETILEEAELGLRNEAMAYQAKDQPMPDELWLKLINARLQVFDAVKRGWVMDSMPRTREQALALSALGIFPKHCVLLDAPDTALIERAAGKRCDPETGDVFHITFDMPSSSEVVNRLVEPSSACEREVVKQLVTFHRHIDGIKACYDHVTKVVNADQPKGDVFSQVMTFVCQRARSAAPHTPRIILIGPTGSGKAVQAQLLAKKYRIVNVCCGHLIKQAIADDSTLGQMCKSFVERGVMVPDDTVLQLLKDRLDQLDCSTRGWVLHGYPCSREQAEQLQASGHIANRVFFLEIPNDSVIERLSLRSTDPITGDRYHLLYNPPRSQEIKGRLIVNAKDTEENVKRRLVVYRAMVDELAEFYVDALYVNAEQDSHHVFESIESMVVKPLPKCKPSNLLK